MKNENYLKVFLGLFSMSLLIFIGSSMLNRAKVDITEEGLYTLSKGSKSILGKIDSEVKLKLYYSKTAANKGTEGLREFNNHFLYVNELLREFVAHSRNNLILEVIDPRPDTPEEEDALAYGLKKFHLTDTEKYFFGLVAENESGSEKIIEFFDPNQKDKLEYDLIKLVYTTLNPQKKTIGIISSLEVLKEDMSGYMEQIMRMQGREVEQSWIVTQLLREFYNVKKIEKDASDISGLDTLVVIHPKGFEEKTLYAIDQYVMKGGNLLVFVDPHVVTDRSEKPGETSKSPDQGFKNLMEKWGINLKENTFAGDKYLSGTGRFNPNMPATRLLPLVNCNGLCVSEYKDTVTSGVEKATFVFPGVLEVKNLEGIKYSPLIGTTSRGNSYQAQGWQLNNPQMLWNSFKEGSKPVVMGYKALGKFKTAFPNGYNKQKKKDKKNLLKESKKESAIIVYSDVDFLTDQFAFRNSFLGPAIANDNNEIFLNSVEALSGNVELMSVRSKGRINRSFDVIEAIEFEAEKATATKVKEINVSIGRFQAELNELGKKANEGNIALLQNEGLRKKKELAKKIAMLKRELREVKREGREKVEAIGKFFQYLNTLLMPLVVIGIGFYYSRRRNRKLVKKEQNHNEEISLKEVKA
jgi:ABC-2 type transport system permease protein